jgi:hypothetical protein
LNISAQIFETSALLHIQLRVICGDLYTLRMKLLTEKKFKFVATFLYFYLLSCVHLPPITVSAPSAVGSEEDRIQQRQQWQLHALKQATTRTATRMTAPTK